MEWKPTFKGNYVPNMNAFPWVVAEIWIFEKLAYKTFNADVDDWADYLSLYFVQAS